MNECDIFMAVLEKGSLQQRKAFLDEACAGNASLRRRIESLLESHGQAGSLLEHPALGAAGTVNLAQGDISTDGAADGRARPATSPDAISLDFLAPADDPQALGRLGPYTVTEIIGRGGMGIVLKAHDPKLNRVVAIKVLAPELAANPTARKRFLREAQAAAAVVHQHVVTIHAVDDDRLPYLVMECIDGQSLQEKIDRAGHLELKEILRIGQQVAAGLAAAHASGLMHRDVKPANILLENGVERVRITDFGLARAVDDVGITKPGEVAGTPQYMSPEQAQGLPMDARSDLFSFGCVLYAMCTGRPPFRAETTLGTIRRVCEETPRPIREVNPDVPSWLVEIIDRLLAKQPAERFQSAQEVANLLGNYLAHVQHPGTELPTIVTAHRGKTAAVPQRRWQPSSSFRRWLAVVAAAVVLLGATLGFTEARGVTHLAATIIRIFTPEGTLVVEVEDPAVKVTVEGDGGLVVSGAGLHEVRLKPGKYQLRADKDGQRVPLSQELVTITRGDKQVVRVRLELTPRDANSWGHRGRSYSGLNKLDEAIADLNKAIELDPRIAWLWADRGDVYAKRQDWDRAISDSSQAVRLEPDTQWICSALMSKYAQAQRFDQAALAADQALSVVPVPEDAWRGNPPLVVAAAEWKEIFERLVKLRPQDPRPWAVRIELLASRGQWQEAVELLPGLIELDGANHWAWYSASVLHLQTNNAEGYRRVSREMLKRFGTTTDVFIADRTAKTLLLVPGAAADVEVPRKLALLAASRAPSNQWFHLTSGLAEYRAGNFEAAALCLRKSISTPAEEPYVEATSLVLMAMSQHRLGRTDEAIESLKRADQIIAQRVPKLASALMLNWGDWIRLDVLRREAAALIEPKPELGAFVVLGADGVAERKFATLADAVEKSSEGDTIEIRGNGPFVTGMIHVQTRRTIRAGQGFHPVISAGAASIAQGLSRWLLEIRAPLVLEGLEFQGDASRTSPVAINSTGVPLYVANCRMSGCLTQAWKSPACQLRNSQFSAAATYAVNFSGSALTLDNNIVATGSAAPLHLPILEHAPRMEISRNVFMGGTRDAWSTGIVISFLAPRPEQNAGLAELRLSRNIVTSPGGIVRANQAPHPPTDPPAVQLSAAELELLPRQRISWHEEQNLYSTGTPLLSLTSSIQGRTPPPLEPTQPLKTLAEWNEYWGQTDTGSLQGVARFQGGDAVYRALYTLYPDDFRLRSDSAGYRTGPDGKDLGPDIDLVGPGAAYERWKTTPEYEKWREETGQEK